MSGDRIYFLPDIYEMIYLFENLFYHKWREETKQERCRFKNLSDTEKRTMLLRLYRRGLRRVHDNQRNVKVHCSPPGPGVRGQGSGVGPQCTCRTTAAYRGPVSTRSSCFGPNTRGEITLPPDSATSPSDEKLRPNENPTIQSHRPTPTSSSVCRMFLEVCRKRKRSIKCSSITFASGKHTLNAAVQTFQRRKPRRDGAFQHRRPRRRKHQPVSECVNSTTVSVRFCVNAAAEGDLNMHRSKGFYTPILVCEESHPVTAL